VAKEKKERENEEIWPGQTGLVRGRIYILAEGLEPLWRRYLDWIASNHRELEGIQI
jgi:hypothetical protein